MLGPFGSIHEFVFTYRTGPDHGIATVQLASIPEDDVTSGAADPTGVLKDISTLSWVTAFTFDAYSAALARNVHDQRGWGANPLRVMGAAGDPLTTAVFDAGLGVYNIDGGPGPYAMRIIMDTKGGAATSYKLDLQDVHRKRIDWAFG
jgi:hypothetical protein